MNKARTGTIFYRRLPAVLISLGAFFAIVMMLSANLASAGPGPKAVRGYVRDNVGNPLEGAHVLVEILYASNGQVRASGTYDSDDDGLYSVMFGPFDFDVGDTIRVTATYNAAQKVNSSLADGNAIQYIDVKFPFEIPQIGGGWVGLALTGAAVGVIALAIMGLPRRKR